MTIRKNPWPSVKFNTSSSTRSTNCPSRSELVFITRVIEGMNVEETAEILSLKPETVKTRLHRARNLLRDNVERKIGPVVMEAFPFAGRRCERLTEAVLTQLGYRA